MARGSFWDELGRDRERQRRAEVARLRAEAQIRRDARREAVGSGRTSAAQMRADGEAEAARLQAELVARMTELAGVLRDVVACSIPTVMQLRAHPPAVESDPEIEEPPRYADFVPQERGLFGRWKRGRAEAEAKSRFDDAFAAYSRRRDEARRQFQDRVALLRTEYEQRIDTLVAAMYRGDHDAPAELAAAALDVVGPLNGFVQGGDGVYRPDAHELAIDVELPAKDVIPVEGRWKYVVSRRCLESEPRRDSAARYLDLIGQLVLGVMTVCFRAFPDDVVDTVTVNGYVSDVDPATGRPARPCVVTVNAARSSFDELRLDSPKLQAPRCLRKLEAEISPSPYTLEPVQPLVDVDVFKRYRLTTPEDLAALDHRVDLMGMHPRDFERLIIALFAEMGYRSWPTQYSHDDGIDGVAVRDDPHLYVECLIQVKRTRNRVPPMMVQALMGALNENPRATHGYFVTTSWFSAETRRRARDQRIQTMEGPQLREHIATYLKQDVLISVRPPANRR